MKIWIMIMMLTATAGLVLAGRPLWAQSAPTQEAVKVGISVPLARHGWTGAVVWWAKDEIAKLSRQYPKVEFIFTTANTPEKQVEDLRDLVSLKVKALVVLPVSDLPLTEVLAEAHRAGVFIVAVDRISPHLPRDVLVTADNQNLGRMCGEIMAQLLSGRGRIAIMEALPSSINTMRVEAFKEVIAQHPDLIIVDSQPVNWNPVTGLEVMEKYLEEHPHLDAIWTGDDSVLIRVLDVYRTSGRTDLKLILGLGGAKEVIKMIMDGDPLVRATIYYPASIISDSIRVAVEHVVDGREFPEEMAIECTLINQGNAAKFYKPDSPY
jgi:ABC-type sugar transport system, periplasmic component